MFQTLLTQVKRLKSVNRIYRLICSVRLLLSALLQIDRESHGDAIVAEGVAKAKREIATNLLRAGSTVTFVVSTTGLSIEEVQLLQQDLNAASAV